MERVLMSSKECQLVILAKLAREDVTECGHSGWMGVCPRISDSRSRDTEMEVI